jgi:hypothetical protein
VLAGVADSFSINQWDKLLPQTILTLNLLRQSNVAPNISAYAYHHGTFDYNRMPIAPMGCSVQFPIKPSRRKTFGGNITERTWLFARRHGQNDWQTLFFKHKYITQPTVTPADAIVNAFTKLRDAIQGIQHSKDDAHFEALRRLEQTLQSQNKQSIKTGEQVKLPRVEH